MKKVFSITLAALFSANALFFASCIDNLREDDSKLQIVASIFPQYDFARSIAGDRAEVTLLLPPGADSHSFDPSMQDIVKMQKADLFIYTGDNMEKWASEFVDSASDDCVILDVSEGVELIGTDTSEHDDHDREGVHEHEINVDPHIWTSPINAGEISIQILTAMCDLDPDNADYYSENFTEYYGQLVYLDENIRACVENAKRNKIYFGGEFSFLYFTQEYGLEYMSLYDSCSESAEPSAKRLTEMTDEMKQNDIPVVFYPELSDPKAAESIAENTGAVPLMLHSCHNLSKEDMEAGKTYLTIMYENLENLKEALS